MSTPFDKIPKSRVLRTTTQSALPKTKMRLLSATGKPIQSGSAPAQQAAVPHSPEEQIEYERQMAEYSKQMEEYNRKMAQYEQDQAAAIAAAAAASAELQTEPEVPVASVAEVPAAAQVPSIPESMVAETPAPAVEPAAAPASTATAKPRLQVARPKLQVKSAAGNPLRNPAASAPAASAAPSDQQAESEEAPARPDYLSSLDQKTVTPFWKSKPFILGLAFLIIAGSYSGYTIMQNDANEKARLEHQAAVNALLDRAKKINRAGVETLADAKAKNVEVVCSMDDAKLLLGVVIDPFVKNEDGNPRYGGNPEGVAQIACLLLGIAAEKDPNIAKFIFVELAENAAEIKPSILSWLIQRMAVADVKQFNKHLGILAKKVADKPDFKRQSEILSAIWEVKGMRVTEKDIPEITSLLKDKSIKPDLSRALITCLINVMDMITDPDKKQEVGDLLFESLPESQRGKLISSLGASKSPKARAYYEERIKDKKNWRSDLRFFSSWGDDSILAFFKELETKAETEQEKRLIKGALGNLFTQARERDDETVNELMTAIFEKVNEDTSDWNTVLNKTDPDGVDFVGEDSPQFAVLTARRKVLEDIRREKMMLLGSLGRLSEFDWVNKLLDRFEQDPDSDIAIEAKKARKSIKANTVQQEVLRERYLKRTNQK